MEKVTIVTLIVLLLLAGMPKDELASMLHTLYPDTQVFEKDNHIHTFKGRLADPSVQAYMQSIIWT